MNAKLPEASAFDITIDNKKTQLYILKNTKGVQVAITNYGGRIVSILAPDKKGNMIDVVEGFDSAGGFQNSTEPYYGALIGRFANRVAKGEFGIDREKYKLFINNEPNTLHGGKPGYQDVIWDAQQTNDTTLVLTYVSKDMEGGFPGNLNIKVTYSLTDDNGLIITYEATTDKTTVINLTSHPFFNLNGAGDGSILDHEVQIFADKITPIGADLIPTGELETITGTAFDFTKPNRIGLRINDDNQQLQYGRGYDHNYVLNPHDANTAVAIAIGDKTGIKMEVYTTEPGMQFYSGNFMQGKNIMKNGNTDDYRTAFAMETQHFPDSPNQPNFPSTLLKPGEVFRSKSEYRFSIAE